MLYRFLIRYQVPQSSGAPIDYATSVHADTPVATAALYRAAEVPGNATAVRIAEISPPYPLEPPQTLTDIQTDHSQDLALEEQL